MPKNQEPQADYIIIGAGSAGSALAHRLTEGTDAKILLLEAGKASHPFTSLPISFGLLIDRPGPNWRFFSEPEENTANRKIPVPRGKLLGGSSSINGQVWVRGQHLDYDTWGQLGNRGWSWSEVRPIFKRMENYEKGGDELRGGRGPQNVTEINDKNPIYNAFFAAAVAAGHKQNPDYNGNDQEGIAWTQASISNGRRMSTAECYLKPIRDRQNLNIITEAHIRRLILEGKRCVGVEYERGGQVHYVRAAREIILSAGAIGSPQILELSGIGRPEILKAQGIGVLHELAAVGENLRDHIIARLQWKISKVSHSYNQRASGIGLIKEIGRYLLTRRGFLTLPAAPIMGFLKTRPEVASPDIQFFMIPYALKDVKRRKPQPFPAMGISVCQLRPESLGSVHIRSADPYAEPAIRFNFMCERRDRDTMIDGVKMVRNIALQGPLDGIRGAELVPGPEVSSDEEIEHWIRTTSETAYHPIGTCRMGPNGVVDDRLRVYGLEGVRVADASIFPTMPSGNTNAPSILVGEKCADLLREDQYL